MTVDLIKQINKDVAITDGARKLTIKGETKNYPVYRIPLEHLFYNEQNGRIATWISQYTTDNDEALDVVKDKGHYNKVLHGFIKNSNPGALTKTKNNIKAFGQRVAGVVLKNGRIIDGNRRFTCLRELSEEGGDYYFDAVILDTDSGISPKDIKRLELNLQHAEEKPVDYNPIDNLVDIYRDIEQEKTFTIKEYAQNTNRTAKEVEKTLKKAILMVEFLNFINASGKYYIARELNLDGPLQEVMGILNKTDEEKNDEVKYALFSALLTSRKGDLTRHIRDIGKDIIRTSSVDDFLTEYEDVVESVYETLQDEEVDLGTITNKIGNNTELKEKSTKIIEKKMEVTRLEAARNKPIDLLNKAYEALNMIEVMAVSRMSDENKKEFNEILSEMNLTIKLLDEKSNV